MIEAGVTFVQVTSYHWDTHGDNFNLHNCLVPQFDQPFAALIEDLHESGMLDHTLVIAMSEFGRTPRINGHAGRDHWPEAWSVAMAGCGLARGAVVGKTNDKGTFVVDQGHDVGDLFHTWFKALGVDSDTTEYDNNGQPLPIALWDYAATSPQPRWLTREAHTGWMKALAISPDGRTLATCAGDRRVRLWSTENGALLRELNGHESPVFCLAFHPDGTALVSG